MGSEASGEQRNHVIKYGENTLKYMKGRQSHQYDDLNSKLEENLKKIEILLKPIFLVGSTCHVGHLLISRCSNDF